MIVDPKKAPTGTLIRAFQILIKNQFGQIDERQTYEYYAAIEEELNKRFAETDKAFIAQRG